MHKFTYATLALLAGTLSASAADIYLKIPGDGGGQNSFENGTNFDGNAPSEGNTYIVNKGYTTNLRTREISSNRPDLSHFFGGDRLVLGDENGPGKILTKTIYSLTNSAHFVFHDGLIQPAQGGGATTASVTSGTTAILGGDALVESPANKPFRFAGSYSRGVRLALDLRGDESTGLMVCRNFTSQASEQAAGHFSTFLDGDNAQYFGRWTVDGYGVKDDYTQGVAPNSSTWQVKLVLADSSKLGGDPTVRQDDGVKLRHAGTIELAASTADQVLDFGNRTVLLVQGGGRIEHNGTGKLTVKGVFAGTDNLTLKTAGDVVFAGEWTGSGNLVVKDQVLHVSSNAKWTGSGQMVAEGTGSIVYDMDGLVNLTEWPAGLEGPFPISRADLFTDPTNGASRVAVVTIPTSVKVVTPADFTAVSDGGLGGDATLAQIGFEIETDAEGLQTVYMTRPAYIWMTTPWVSAEAASPHYFTDTVSQNPTQHATKNWSDGMVAHEDGDYLVYAAHAVRMADRPIETFPGKSLTLVGIGSERAELALKGKTNVVAKIFAGNRSDISFKAYSGTNRQVLTGSIYATGKFTGGDTLGFRISGSSGKADDTPYPSKDVRVVEVNADISGDADIRLSPYDQHTMHIVLSGDNRGHVGTVSVIPYGQATTTLVITNECNIGGNPPSYNANGLRIIDGAHLYVENDVTLDQPNRGLYLQRQACFDVAGDATLDVRLPTTYNKGTYNSGIVQKNGSGTLKLSGETKGGAPDTRYQIRGGALEQANLAAFERLKTLAFYPETTLIVPYQQEQENGLLLKGIASNTEYPLVLAGGAEKLNVRLDVPAGTKLERHFTVPLVTVPKTAVASTMAAEENPVAVTSAAQLTVASPAKSYVTKVVAEDISINGIDYVRYSADCAIPGMVVNVR